MLLLVGAFYVVASTVYTGPVRSITIKVAAAI
jgi:hypothetical protein